GACVEQDDKGWDARKRAYCLKIQPATGSFARNLIYSTKPQLWCIQQLDEPEEIIGILWLSLTGSSAWISDFYIYPDWRSRGFGGLALNVMKTVLKEMGINEVGLRVAPNNASAKALYHNNGFHITGINMTQNLN
ncbi:GNAT family N-acetyltransferase, partial [uncultured Pantoea sp.]|uniref:GNAT family N-acetyltransferase n=1 Tax=uncultured Pantoea sp. TaxID=218084 RepID=UPI002805A0F8